MLSYFNDISINNLFPSLCLETSIRPIRWWHEYHTFRSTTQASLHYSRTLHTAMFCYDLNIIIQVIYDSLRVFCFYIIIADCPAGSYSSLNRTCSLCPRGTYQPSRGRPSCIFCGQNLTTSSSGTADRNHCIGKQSLFSMTKAGWRSQLNTIRLTSASALHTDIKTAFLDSFFFLVNNLLQLKSVFKVLLFLPYATGDCNVIIYPGACTQVMECSSARASRHSVLTYF